MGGEEGTMDLLTSLIRGVGSFSGGGAGEAKKGVAAVPVVAGAAAPAASGSAQLDPGTSNIEDVEQPADEIHRSGSYHTSRHNVQVASSSSGSAGASAPEQEARNHQVLHGGAAYHDTTAGSGAAAADSTGYNDVYDNREQQQRPPTRPQYLQQGTAASSKNPVDQQYLQQHQVDGSGDGEGLSSFAAQYDYFLNACGDSGEQFRRTPGDPQHTRARGLQDPSELGRGAGGHSSTYPAESNQQFVDRTRPPPGFGGRSEEHQNTANDPSDRHNGNLNANQYRNYNTSREDAAAASRDERGRAGPSAGISPGDGNTISSPSTRGGGLRHPDDVESNYDSCEHQTARALSRGGKGGNALRPTRTNVGASTYENEDQAYYDHFRSGRGPPHLSGPRDYAYAGGYPPDRRGGGEDSYYYDEQQRRGREGDGQYGSNEFCRRGLPPAGPPRARDPGLMSPPSPRATPGSSRDNNIASYNYFGRADQDRGGTGPLRESRGERGYNNSGGPMSSSRYGYGSDRYEKGGRSSHLEAQSFPRDYDLDSVTSSSVYDVPPGGRGGPDRRDGRNDGRRIDPPPPGHYRGRDNVGAGYNNIMDRGRDVDDYSSVSDSNSYGRHQDELQRGGGSHGGPPGSTMGATSVHQHRGGYYNNDPRRDLRGLPRDNLQHPHAGAGPSTSRGGDRGRLRDNMEDHVLAPQRPSVDEHQRRGDFPPPGLPFSSYKNEPEVDHEHDMRLRYQQPLQHPTRDFRVGAGEPARGERRAPEGVDYTSTARERDPGYRVDYTTAGARGATNGAGDRDCDRIERDRRGNVVLGTYNYKPPSSRGGGDTRAEDSRSYTTTSTARNGGRGAAPGVQHGQHQKCLTAPKSSQHDGSSRSGAPTSSGGGGSKKAHKSMNSRSRANFTARENQMRRILQCANAAAALSVLQRTHPADEEDKDIPSTTTATGGDATTATRCTTSSATMTAGTSTPNNFRDIEARQEITNRVRASDVVLTTRHNDHGATSLSPEPTLGQSSSAEIVAGAAGSCGVEKEISMVEGTADHSQTTTTSAAGRAASAAGRATATQVVPSGKHAEMDRAILARMDLMIKSLAEHHPENQEPQFLRDLDDGGLDATKRPMQKLFDTAEAIAQGNRLSSAELKRIPQAQMLWRLMERDINDPNKSDDPTGGAGAGGAPGNAELLSEQPFQGASSETDRDAMLGAPLRHTECGAHMRRGIEMTGRGVAGEGGMGVHDNLSGSPNSNVTRRSAPETGSLRSDRTSEGKSSGSSKALLYRGAFDWMGNTLDEDSGSRSTPDHATASNTLSSSGGTPGHQQQYKQTTGGLLPDDGESSAVGGSSILSSGGSSGYVSRNFRINPAETSLDGQSVSSFGTRLAGSGPASVHSDALRSATSCTGQSSTISSTISSQTGAGTRLLQMQPGTSGNHLQHGSSNSRGQQQLFTPQLLLQNLPKNLTRKDLRCVVRHFNLCRVEQAERVMEPVPSRGTHAGARGGYNSWGNSNINMGAQHQQRSTVKVVMTAEEALAEETDADREVTQLHDGPRVLMLVVNHLDKDSRSAFIQRCWCGKHKELDKLFHAEDIPGDLERSEPGTANHEAFGMILKKNLSKLVARESFELLLLEDLMLRFKNSARIRHGTLQFSRDLAFIFDFDCSVERRREKAESATQLLLWLWRFSGNQSTTRSATLRLIGRKEGNNGALNPVFRVRQVIGRRARPDVVEERLAGRRWDEFKLDPSMCWTLRSGTPPALVSYATEEAERREKVRQTRALHSAHQNTLLMASIGVTKPANANGPGQSKGAVAASATEGKTDEPTEGDFRPKFDCTYKCGSRMKLDFRMKDMSIESSMIAFADRSGIPMEKVGPIRPVTMRQLRLLQSMRRNGNAGGTRRSMVRTSSQLFPSESGGADDSMHDIPENSTTFRGEGHQHDLCEDPHHLLHDRPCTSTGDSSGFNDSDGGHGPRAAPLSTMALNTFVYAIPAQKKLSDVSLEQAIQVLYEQSKHDMILERLAGLRLPSASILNESLLGSALAYRVSSCVASWFYSQIGFCIKFNIGYLEATQLWVEGTELSFQYVDPNRNHKRITDTFDPDEHEVILTPLDDDAVLDSSTSKDETRHGDDDDFLSSHSRSDHADGRSEDDPCTTNGPGSDFDSDSVVEAANRAGRNALGPSAWNKYKRSHKTAVKKVIQWIKTDRGAWQDLDARRAQMKLKDFLRSETRSRAVTDHDHDWNAGLQLQLSLTPRTSSTSWRTCAQEPLNLDSFFPLDAFSSYYSHYNVWLNTGYRRMRSIPVHRVATNLEEYKRYCDAYLHTHFVAAGLDSGVYVDIWYDKETIRDLLRIRKKRGGRKTSTEVDADERDDRGRTVSASTSAGEKSAKNTTSRSGRAQTTTGVSRGAPAPGSEALEQDGGEDATPGPTSSLSTNKYENYGVPLSDLEWDPDWQ
eukprot:g5523.t1